MGKIFICYRRDDSQHQAGRLFDRLAAKFGEERVFWDVDAIPFAVKFPDRIRAAISECDVMLVLIGDRWLDIRDAKGNRRLDDAGDYVRLEIEEALRQGVTAVPVLLDEASMPSREELPPTCGELAEINAPRVRAGADFNYHVGRLLDTIAGVIADHERRHEEERLRLTRDAAERERVVREQANREAQEKRAAALREREARERVAQERRSRTVAVPPRSRLAWFAAVAVAAGAAVIALAVFHRFEPPPQGRPVTATSSAPAPAPPSRAPTPPAARPAPVAKPEDPKEITNSIGMRLTLIPAGEFTMGSNETQADLEAAQFAVPFSVDDEHPAHRVRVTRPFYLGTHEVTKGQFAAFVAATEYRTDAEKDGLGGWGYDTGTKEFEQKPSFDWRNTGFPQTDEHPVANVSWNDAVAFCQWLGQKEGGDYRLPTEAEWEYACRAGTTTRYFAGDDPQSLAGYANVRDASFKLKFPGLDYVKAPVSPFDDGFPFTAPVGSFKPNALGLFDMHGNVLEWCQDWYDAVYYAHSTPNDPNGPIAGDRRVLRGGAFTNQPVNVRSAFRFNYVPTDRTNATGFRSSRTYP